MKQPFYHDNIKQKRAFLELARRYDQLSEAETDIQLKGAYVFASALLFMNHADYLAQWFAYSLQELVDRGIESYYYRSITLERKSRDVQKHITIGESKDIIKRYNFSDKQQMLELLDKISKARNTIAHQMLKMDPTEFEKFDTNFSDLRDGTEDLIKFTDQFKVGMPPKNLGDNLIAIAEK